MKILCCLPLLLAYCVASAQSGPAAATTVMPGVVSKKSALHSSFEKGSVMATISVGFIDQYRENYSLPTGFKLNNTTGFSPVYGKLEYGISNKISLGATFCYDVFYSNFYQLYQANGNEYKRYKTDKFKSFSGGLVGYYHLTSLIPIKKLDVFVGAGISLNNNHHTALAQGDSTVAATEYNVSPIIKAGARYYLSKQGSLYADAGYDKKTVFSVGFSCRFFKH